MCLLDGIKYVDTIFFSGIIFGFCNSYGICAEYTVFSREVICCVAASYILVIHMGLTNKREEQLKAMPIIKSTVGKSKDGKYIVHRTVITHIKPTAYYDAVLNGKLAVAEENIEDELKELA